MLYTDRHFWGSYNYPDCSSPYLYKFSLICKELYCVPLQYQKCHEWFISGPLYRITDSDVTSIADDCYLFNYRLQKCERRKTYTRSDTNLKRHFNSWRLRYTRRTSRYIYMHQFPSYEVIRCLMVSGSILYPAVLQMWCIRPSPSSLSHLSGSVLSNTLVSLWGHISSTRMCIRRLPYCSASSQRPCKENDLQNTKSKSLPSRVPVKWWIMHITS